MQVMLSNILYFYDLSTYKSIYQVNVHINKISNIFHILELKFFILKTLKIVNMKVIPFLFLFVCLCNREETDLAYTKIELVSFITFQSIL